MKNKYYIAIALTAALGLVSCHDDRDNFMVEDTILFAHDKDFVEISVFSDGYEVSVIKSGRGRSSAGVDLFVADSVRTRYNAANGTTYTLLPENLYTLSGSHLDFSASDARKTVRLQWKPSDIVPIMSGKEYVIPFKLLNSDIKVNGKKDHMLLCMRPTSLKIDDAEASPQSPGASETHVDTLKSSLSIDFPISGRDLEVGLELDNSLVAAYNAAHGTDYAVAPEGLVSLEKNKVTIGRSKTSVEFRYLLHSAKLFKDGALEVFPPYLVPIRISSVSIDGMTLGNDVLYVPVRLPSRTIKGPWTVLEGGDICFGKEAGAPGWALQYLVERMVDGDPATEWISPWSSPITFPIVFVFDMGESHIFNVLKIKDHSTHQGQYRQYEFHMAAKYEGAATEWKKIAEGQRGFDWIAEGNVYDFPVQSKDAGRYMKFVIVRPEFALDNPDYMRGRGKLAEIYGEGY